MGKTDALPPSSVNNECCTWRTTKERRNILQKTLSRGKLCQSEDEESKKEWMNAMKQAKINGGASSQVPTFRFPIMDEPTDASKELLHPPTLLNEWARGLESDSRISSYWRVRLFSLSGVHMEKPLVKMEIEAMIQAAVEQTHTGGKRNWMICAESGAGSYPTFSHELPKKDRIRITAYIYSIVLVRGQDTFDFVIISIHHFLAYLFRILAIKHLSSISIGITLQVEYSLRFPPTFLWINSLRIWSGGTHSANDFPIKLSEEENPYMLLLLESCRVQCIWVLHDQALSQWLSLLYGPQMDEVYEGRDSSYDLSYQKRLRESPDASS